jgi:hypothetical protein
MVNIDFIMEQVGINNEGARMNTKEGRSNTERKILQPCTHALKANNPHQYCYACNVPAVAL